MYALLKTLKQWDAVASCYSFGEYYHVVMKSDFVEATTIEHYLLDNQFEEIEVKKIAANIEDSFMALMYTAHD
jgi:predicted NAD-dependent protein-ADP-ribosyltransferase YbiA (DUF1768 family)